MKKLLTGGLIAVTALCGVLGFTACEKGHDHQWGEWVSDGQGEHYRVCQIDSSHVERQKCDEDCESLVTEPTCEQEGFTLKTCRVCDYQFIDDKVAPLGHEYRYHFDEETKEHTGVCLRDESHTVKAKCSFGEGVETKPTCEENGFTTFVCEICSGSYTQYDEATQKATGHRYSEEWIPAENGMHYRVCLNNPLHTEEGECSFTQEVKISATCTASGYTEHICPDCGNSRVDSPIAPLGHDFVGAEYVSKENGMHYRVCKHPDCNFVEESVCSDFAQEELEATCTRDGQVIKTCKSCGYQTITVTQSALGHLFRNYRHEGDAQSDAHTATCERANCNETDTQNCTFSVEHATKEATCTKEGSKTDLCTVCGFEKQTVIQALGHDYGDWVSGGDGKHSRSCNRNCNEEGNVQQETCELKESSRIPTLCVEAGIATRLCEDCGYSEEEVFPSLGHVWETEENSGWKPGSGGKHYRKCVNCQFLEEAECHYSTTETDPTCENDGKRVKSCATCKNVVTEILPSLGHVLTSYTFHEDVHGDSVEHFHTGHCSRCNQDVKEACQLQLSASSEATCEKEGTTTYTCLHCTHVHTYITAPAKGHRWSDVYTFDENRHTHSAECLNGCGQTKEEACTKTNEVVVKPTCTLGGYTTYTCSVCRNQFRDNPTESLGGHVWGYRNYNSQYDQHTKYCTRDGCTVNMPEKCAYETEIVQPTCTTDGYSASTCTLCKGEKGKETVTATGHSFGAWTYDGSGDNHTHFRVCVHSNCNERETGTCVMEPVSTVATCTQGGENDLICKTCNHNLDFEQTGPLGHDYEYQYLYENQHKQICKRCGESQIVSCTIETTFRDGTCTTPIEEISLCKICNHTDTKTLSAMGHQWGDWQISEDHSTHTRSCTQCKTTETSGHDFSESNFCLCGEDGLNYELSQDGTFYIVVSSDKLRNTKRVIIPSRHEDRPVQEIGKYAFANRKNLQEVVIPSTVKVIQDSAFFCCFELSRVSVGEYKEGVAQFVESVSSQLTEIGEYAFYSDRKLVTFPMPQSVVRIGRSAFEFCEKYEDFEIPDTVLDIGKSAFSGTKRVSDVESWQADALYLGRHLIRVRTTHSGEYTIQENTLSVAAEAFADCVNLTKVIIPKGVKIFDHNAFKGCTSLSSAEYRGNVEDWFQIKFGNDFASPLHYAESFHIDGAEGKIENIPDSVTSIPAGTFRNTKITSIVIPDSVTRIGAYAFYGCDELSSIEIPDSVTYIGENAFAGTAYYKSKEKWDENGLLYIGNHLIKANSGKNVVGSENGNATALEKMTSVPKDVAEVKGEIELKAETVTISARAFEDCDQLLKITIGEKVSFIGKLAFSGCSGLKNAIVKGSINFLSWTLMPNSTEHWIGRGVTPNGTGDESSQRSMATLLRSTYLGEWTRYQTKS